MKKWLEILVAVLLYVSSANADTKAVVSKKPILKPSKKITKPTVKTRPVAHPVITQAAYIAKAKALYTPVLELLSELNSPALQWQEAIKNRDMVTKMYNRETYESGLPERVRNYQKYIDESEPQLKKLIPSTRTAIQRLKTISPASSIPVAMKKHDDALRKFSREADAALEIMQSGLDKKEHIPMATGWEKLSSAMTRFSATHKALERLSKPSLASEKVVDG